MCRLLSQEWCWHTRWMSRSPEKVSCVLGYLRPPPALSVCLRDPLLNQNRHLWPEHNGPHCSAVKGVACAALRPLLAADPPSQTTCTFSLLIEEHSYAWVTSSKVPGGCGKGPVSKCGLSGGGLSEKHSIELSEIRESRGERSQLYFFGRRGERVD